MLLLISGRVRVVGGGGGTRVKVGGGGGGEEEGGHRWVGVIQSLDKRGGLVQFNLGRGAYIHYYKYEE